LTNITQTAASQYGAAQIGKALGRLSCGGDLHFDPAEGGPFTPPLTMEVKVGDKVIGTAEITGFDVRREQVGPNGATRVLLIANEAD
jgi:hypothetical protein